MTKVRLTQNAVFIFLVESLFMIFLIGGFACFLMWLLVDFSFYNLIYTIWFSVSAFSLKAMIEKKLWGAYTLICVTLLISLIDMFRGMVTMPGIMLGLMVLVIVLAYLYEMSDYQPE